MARLRRNWRKAKWILTLTEAQLVLTETCVFVTHRRAWDEHSWAPGEQNHKKNSAGWSVAASGAAAGRPGSSTALSRVMAHDPGRQNKECWGRTDDHLSSRDYPNPNPLQAGLRTSITPLSLWWRTILPGLVGVHGGKFRHSGVTERTERRSSLSCTSHLCVSVASLMDH